MKNKTNKQSGEKKKTKSKKKGPYYKQFLFSAEGLPSKFINETYCKDGISKMTCLSLFLLIITPWSPLNNLFLGLVLIYESYNCSF